MSVKSLVLNIDFLLWKSHILIQKSLHICQIIFNYKNDIILSNETDRLWPENLNVYGNTLPFLNLNKFYFDF